MVELDYEKLGLKVGIEIHQRLRTNKLFCDCPVEDGEPGRVYHRRLRAVAGELGAVDPAALYEYTRGREFDYVAYKNTCLVELDDEPPHSINPEAFFTALQVAKTLSCDIPDEIQVMRKTVVDGSNTSGFQRTAMVGLSGKLRTSFGDVGITNISLEEESSQILERSGRTVRYGLDRLGIPLIEIGTAPDMRTAKQARETAEAIGLLLRSTGRVMRGIGTIRQDVNVSIAGGARVEIKGFQELRILEELVRNEAERQESLLVLMEELNARKAGAGEPSDVTDVFTNTQNKMLAKALAEGKRVYAFVLKGFGGLLKTVVCAQRTFGRELTDYAVAQGTKGMIHTDEDVEKYGLDREFTMLRSALNAGAQDAICVIAEDSDVALKASLAVIKRAQSALVGVPEETRAPNADGTSSYLRPLPGGARMYPETDVPPTTVDAKVLASIKEPESLDSRKKRLVAKGMPLSIAEELVRSELLQVFDEAQPKEITRAGELLTSTMTALRREGVRVDAVSTEDLVKLLRSLGKIPKEAVPNVLKLLSEGKSYEESVQIDHISDVELERIVETIIKDNMNLVDREGEASFKKLMGPLMAKVRGKIPGERASDALKKRLRSFLR